MLLHGAARLLCRTGSLCVILPAVLATPFAEQAAAHGLYRTAEVQVRSKPSVAPFRTLLRLQKHPAGCNRHELIIHTAHDDYSPEFVELQREFYLRF